ncbi:hypothetical protein [Alkalihalobacterium chitinilyticum]|uniref:Phr family secreted Rap phosphatase inhibitor n=1 Tax=Alkalihalobacterium chitinilyticum TaxID=2980103 RepID=A0ABT5VFQ3_9BACI|nr:hypothetical protein [Alkalihalobacterium chitinilyticum]MDE5414001.1 hypothetical protein [Alkalihalobacterium chitinilyticum]
MMMKKAKKTFVLTAVVVGLFFTSFTGVMAHDEITPNGKPGYVHSD